MGLGCIYFLRCTVRILPTISKNAPIKTDTIKTFFANCQLNPVDVLNINPKIIAITIPKPKVPHIAFFPINKESIKAMIAMMPSIFQIEKIMFGKFCPKL